MKADTGVINSGDECSLAFTTHDPMVSRGLLGVDREGREVIGDVKLDAERLFARTAIDFCGVAVVLKLAVHQVPGIAHLVATKRAPRIVLVFGFDAAVLVVDGVVLGRGPRATEVRPDTDVLFDDSTAMPTWWFEIHDCTPGHFVDGPSVLILPHQAQLRYLL
jgi:hypothetical protein